MPKQNIYQQSEDEVGVKTLHLLGSPVADSYAATRVPPTAYVPEVNTTISDGSVGTAALASNAVTDAKLRTSAALSVIGRSANSVGNVADISAGTDLQVLRRNGTTLDFNLIVDAGTYTATLTGVTNIDSVTSFEGQYIRVGSIVTVSGKGTIDPTAAAASEVGIALPIASNIGAVEDCCGTAAWTGVAQESAGIRGDATNKRAAMVWVATDTSAREVTFTFTYQII